MIDTGIGIDAAAATRPARTSITALVPRRTWLGWAAAATAGAVGAWVSFGFGVRIGGLPMGVVAAANGGVMAALLFTSAADAANAVRASRR
jgi:hypothetical protein